MRCAPSVDIGAYNTCRGRCPYCYATKDHREAARNRTAASVDFPMLCDEVRPDDKIYDKKVVSLKSLQQLQQMLGL